MVRKLRPAVLLADAGRWDWILCQVTDLLNAVQEQTFLPPEMSQSLTRLIVHTRDQVSLLRTEIAKLDEV